MTRDFFSPLARLWGTKQKSQSLDPLYCSVLLAEHFANIRRLSVLENPRCYLIKIEKIAKVIINKRFHRSCIFIP